jgi:hypothetical protein
MTPYEQAKYDLSRGKPGDGQAVLRTQLPVTGDPEKDKPKYVPVTVTLST